MTSPNGTLIVGLSGSITDVNGNVWAVNANQQVTVNGLVDSTTSGVGLLGYDNGLIWQENTADRWYSKTSPSAPWSNYPQGSPSPVPLPPASANGTSITAGDGSIVDAQGQVWAINASGQITVDGFTDTTSANVIQMIYAGGKVWQENAADLWWSKATPAAAWLPGPGSPTGPALPPLSATSITVLVGPDRSFTDGQGNVWQINGDGQIIVNGKVDPTTSGVELLAYYGGVVWQKNTSNLWYSKTTASAAWVDYPAGNPPPIPLQPASDNDTTVGQSGSITDSHGNVWTINAAGKVVVDGFVDPATANVVQLDYVNGRIWQENTAGLWYSKAAPSDAWTSGTTVNPISHTPVALTWTGAVSTNGLFVNNWSPAAVPGPGDSLSMTSGTINLANTNLSGDTLTIADSSNTGQTVVLNLQGGVDLKLAGGANLSDILTINVEGSDSLNNNNTSYIEEAVNLAANADLVVTGTMNFGYTLEVNGPGADLVNNGLMMLHSASIDANLTGQGTLDVLQYHDGEGSTALGGLVGSGQTIDINGQDLGANLTISQPQEFSGLINLLAPSITGSPYPATGGDSVTIQGLLATSFSYANDVLTLFNGNSAIDAVRLNNQSGQALTVAQLSQSPGYGPSVLVSFGGPQIGQLLPVHV